MKCYQNPSRGNGRADGQRDMKKITFTIGNFPKAQQNVFFLHDRIASPYTEINLLLYPSHQCSQRHFPVRCRYRSVSTHKQAILKGILQQKLINNNTNVLRTLQSTLTRNDSDILVLHCIAYFRKH